MALPISATDDATATAAANDISEIMSSGATVGLTEVIPATTNFSPTTDVVNAFKSISAGILRQTQVVGSAVTLSIESGTPQTQVVNTAFTKQLTVVVRDAYNNLVPGVAVTFTAPGSGASASLSSPALTNANGETSVIATANSTTGTYSVVASIFGLPTTVEFVLTNVSAALTLTAIKGTPQSQTLAYGFLETLTVVVRDSANKVVPGITVAFAVPGSGASAVLSSPAVTDANGETYVTASANSTAGTYSVTASVAGIPNSVEFVLTNVDSKIVYASAFATAQTVTGNNAYYTVNFSNVFKDTASGIISGPAWRYKCQSGRAGLFHVDTMIAVTSPNSGDNAELSLWKVASDGVTESLETVLTATRTPSVGGSIGSFLGGSSYIELQNNESLRIKIRVSNASNQSLVTSTGANWIRIFRESDTPA